MPPIPAGHWSPWGVRAVLNALLVICAVYGKHRARCEHYLPSELCGIISAVCDAEASIRSALETLPASGTWE